jgi:hypothetical protein
VYTIDKGYWFNRLEIQLAIHGQTIDRDHTHLHHQPADIVEKLQSTVKILHTLIVLALFNWRKFSNQTAYLCFLFFLEYIGNSDF